MQRIPRHILILSSVLVFLWNCAPQPGAGASPQDLDKLNKAQARDEKFQKVAFQKITELEKSLAEVKKSQQQLSKVVRDLQQMKPGTTSPGTGSARLDSLADALAKMSQRLQRIEQSLTTVSSPPPGAGWQNYEAPQPTRSDQEAILQRFGDPIERHLTDSNTEVWLYRNGVVTFDEKGQLTSIKFD
ncbi:MAG: hypothetical protein K9N22_09905 [Candidatus Marinimicrobia bacterium]|nr:hypothetical protein [Candidatus Neomarinimicrobiota bacterium]MCF7841076.1 hypothetical protein [Candidatus Neomarinimicrobiota bacterium]